ncbi:MAG: DUF2339 domain-containing protein [Flavobacterium sp.]|nr:DUF2339 domain-containing protein [Flavobacterium sp.]
MIEVLKVEEVKEKSNIEFISTILKDYDYYLQKKGLDTTPPIITDTKTETPVKPVKIVASAKTVMTAAPTTKKIIQQPVNRLWERFKQRNPDLEKFIGENLINKIGILILVLGISYFVKFAIDKNWINEPARVGIGVLAGGLVLFIAHKLRQKYAPFSSVLVAGAISIFYFTIAIAFHEYKLFGQEIAFAIMIVITAFSCFISLSYNRMELAILSLIGGFLVPFMLDLGNENYIILFIYIAILDIGILTLAYFKKWQLLHVLAFVFSILLFGSWVIMDMKSNNPHYVESLIFGLVFYLIFIAISIISNLQSKENFSKPQLAMLITNNFGFYGIGMLILAAYKPEFNGLFTLFLALLNISYSLLLYKTSGLLNKGIYVLIGLSLTFITLTIPIQFTGNSITIFWAAEAVLLMWLAQKTQIKNYRFVAGIVQFLMLCSLLKDWPSYFSTNELFPLVLNPIFITGLFVVASFVAVSYLLRKETEKLSIFGLVFDPESYRTIANILAVIIGYFVGLFEVLYQSSVYFKFNTLVSIGMQYHLLFTGIFCFFLYKSLSLKNTKIINVLAVVNIIALTFIFFVLPFSEFRENITNSMNVNIVYYLHMLSFVFIGYFCYLIYHTNKKEKVFSVFNHKLVPWIAVFVLVFVASTEVVLQGLHLMNFSLDSVQLNDNYGTAYERITSAKFKIIKTGLPILWGILAFALLLFGIKKQIKVLRIIALALLGLTIVKLFVYDISNVSETGKIIAFILLGMLILVISFIYQKIKVLVVDEDKNN